MNTHSDLFSQTTAESGEGEAMPTLNSVSPRTNIVPDVSPPSIGSSAMLSQLSISQWTARKKDRAIHIAMAWKEERPQGIQGCDSR